MVKIRLSRKGAKGRPFYHIVVTDKRNARDAGSYIERIGYFNQIATGQETAFHVDADRMAYWVSKGAQLSERIADLLKKHKTPVAVAEKKAA
jgi:small subunit ribosomal protein S16